MWLIKVMTRVVPQDKLRNPPCERLQQLEAYKKLFIRALQNPSTTLYSKLSLTLLFILKALNGCCISLGIVSTGVLMVPIACDPVNVDASQTQHPLFISPPHLPTCYPQNCLSQTCQSHPFTSTSITIMIPLTYHRTQTLVHGWRSDQRVRRPPTLLKISPGRCSVLGLWAMHAMYNPSLLMVQGGVRTGKSDIHSLLFFSTPI